MVINIDNDGFVLSRDFSFRVSVENENRTRDVWVDVTINEERSDVSVKVTLDEFVLSDEKKAELCDFVRDKINNGHLHLPTFIPFNCVSSMDEHEGYFENKPLVAE